MSSTREILEATIEAADEFDAAQENLREAQARFNAARRALQRHTVDLSKMSDEGHRATTADTYKVRGQATQGILDAMPGSLSEIAEKTGIKKTTVSTLLARLRTNGVIDVTHEQPMPGYANRTEHVYGLVSQDEPEPATESNPKRKRGETSKA